MSARARELAASEWKASVLASRLSRAEAQLDEARAERDALRELISEMRDDWDRLWVLIEDESAAPGEVMAIVDNHASDSPRADS